MKFATALPFAALAGAFVLPAPFNRLFAVSHDHHHEHHHHRHAASSWWHKLSSKANVHSAIDSFSSGIESAVHAAENLLDLGSDPAADLDLELADDERPPHRGRPHPPPPTANLTIYELIQKSNHTTKFAKLVDKFDDVVSLLNSTKANYTLFVPIDEAFEHIPHHGDKKPSDEFLEKLLRYHIAAGWYPAGRVARSPTIPTIVEEKWLGGEAQRLRINVGLSGIFVNFFDKIVKANIPAKNGVIHAVNKILIPPTFVGAELSFVPTVFSTLLHAYDKTDFVDFIHHVHTTGSTVFAPTNSAFEKLGPRANAFLFNTPKGLGFLKALLKYQIVANATLYSNAFYSVDGDAAGRPADDVSAAERSHIELKTLLNGTGVGVDISRWGTWVSIKLNGYVPVVVRDTVALNGVIQVVGRVPIPPRKPHLIGAEALDDGEIEVEDLIERLEPFVLDEQAEDAAGEL